MLFASRSWSDLHPATEPLQRRVPDSFLETRASLAPWDDVIVAVYGFVRDECSVLPLLFKEESLVFLDRECRRRQVLLLLSSCMQSASRSHECPVYEDAFFNRVTLASFDRCFAYIKGQVYYVGSISVLITFRPNTSRNNLLFQASTVGRWLATLRSDLPMIEKGVVPRPS